MSRWSVTFAGLACLFLGRSAMSADTVHEFKVKSIEGKEVDLSQYKGKVLLIVNVASHCGNTPQYEQLEALHEKYGEKGLVVLGFPCNQFGGQEPGTSEEIQTFCRDKYDVQFPLFEKISVNGDESAPLYTYLKEHAEPDGDVKWNFEKFLVDKDGHVLARIAHRTKPDSEDVIKMIEEALGK